MQTGTPVDFGFWVVVSRQTIQFFKLEDTKFKIDIKNFMSWTQVYITGLSRALDPSNENIENHLEKRYKLADDEESTIL